MQSLLDQLAKATTIEWFSDLQKHRLRVTGGAHTGAEKKCVLGLISLGSAPENDFVLFGDSLAARHFIVRQAKGFRGGLVVEAIDGAITLGGAGRLEPGESMEMRGSLQIVAEGASVVIERVIDTTTIIAKSVTGGLALAAVSAVAIAINLGMTFADDITSGFAPADGKMNAQMDGEGEKLEKTDNDIAGSKLADAVMWNVRTKLEQIGLNYLVRAETTPDSSIRVYGSIPPSKEAPWDEFLHWYDGQHRFPKLVREVVRSEGEAQMPELQSVWLDGVPTAHFSDGKSAQAGDPISDGWTVVSITRTMVVLERDGTKITLNF